MHFLPKTYFEALREEEKTEICFLGSEELKKHLTVHTEKRNKDAFGLK